ncbi:Ribonucleases P/MRP protein subunit POP1 [Rhynchospora pubera]|uniref:Ribonucleases P/MRP protein subunit POP1 n=2 Tax=Rhynchospora pubera TaxID=906938 RepID=A0AAV8FZR3_9POAL|nr:Ribonucleases P/MRP protein subunit POP1 [Rhynchospora pubera]
MAVTSENPPPPPRTLNVQKCADARRPEIESLHSLVSNRLSSHFRLPRSLRRRTTSHVRRPKRRRSGEGADDQDNGEGDEKKEKKLCRRERRRRELTGNPELGFVVAADGTRRLRTHVWHAKRFRMVKRWGFYLPLGVQGRGRGSRAVLKLLQKGALVHDASYYLPIQLEGPQDCILSVLRMVLIPSPPVVAQMSSESLFHKVLQGACHQNAMLYHMDSSASHFVAPVLYMWQRMTSERVEWEISSVRKLWIWIHAAAFHEGCNALRIACEKQQKSADGVTVSCIQQEGRIARLDIMGNKASEVMSKILCPVTISNKTIDGHEVPEAQQQFNMDQIQKFPPGAILQLRVKDPRLLSSEVNSEFNEVGIDLVSSDTCKPSDNMELWDSQCNLDPPVPENILCREKNRKRLNSLFLEPMSQEVPGGRQQDVFSQSCPVVLLKHGHQTTFLGWSIILPLSWVKTFWLSLVSRGGHAIGLRERRWVAWKNHVPCFPHDFPDTEGYRSLLTDEGTLLDASAQLRPHRAQPQKTPMPPPWDCVVAYLHHICRNAVKFEFLTLDMYVPRTNMTLKEHVERMDSKDMISAGDVEVTDGGGEKETLCLVRVFVRPFKEGLFEDGSLVCAPCADDLPGWNSRSEKEVEKSQEKWQLQLKQSSVESYFMQLESGKWALQVPEDPADLKTFRWPIGFITTGAVHACNDRVSVGFCDIRILAALRRQQYLQTEIKRPEIFVLVRNMKSAAYRRAIATIVLEQQQEDLLFL